MKYNYIETALERYHMECVKYELIRHNENMTVKVDDQYLLRVHRHAKGFSTGPLYERLNRADIYKSELAFLVHLSRQGMKVQSPVPNSDGELLTVLDDGTCATMLKWIPGRVLEKNDVNEDMCFQIGSMVARMHKAAAGFKTGEILDYDSQLCRRLQNKIIQTKEKGLIAEELLSVMETACDVMQDRLRTNHNMITVHADLSLSNILIGESELVPIDFSLFGRGNPMMDISSLYGSINGVENRCAIAEGYRSLGGTIEFTMLDVYFALNVLLYIILHMDGNAGQEGFNANIGRWCREIFQPLVDGKRLFNDDFYMLNVGKR